MKKEKEDLASPQQNQSFPKWCMQLLNGVEVPSNNSEIITLEELTLRRSKRIEE